jgi:hypothetical protein
LRRSTPVDTFEISTGMRFVAEVRVIVNIASMRNCGMAIPV